MSADDLDDDERAIVTRLRALPDEGREPDWDRFGRELGAKLDATPAKPWWRRWWTPTIGFGLAVATAAVFVAWPAGTAAPPDAERVAVLTPDAAPQPKVVAAVVDVLAFGAEGELDDAELDDDAVVTEVMAALEIEADADDEETMDDVPDEPVDGLVPDLDLDWVDDLDDEDLAAIDAWLDDEAG